MGIGTTELIVICVVGLLLFGNQLPGVAKSIAVAIRDFKKGINDE